jgi:hypothetical protein
MRNRSFRRIDQLPSRSDECTQSRGSLGRSSIRLAMTVLVTIGAFPTAVSAIKVEPPSHVAVVSASLGGLCETEWAVGEGDLMCLRAGTDSLFKPVLKWFSTPRAGEPCELTGLITPGGIGCHTSSNGGYQWFDAPSPGESCFGKEDIHNKLWCLKKAGGRIWRSPVGVRCENSYERWATLIAKNNGQYSTDDFLCALNSKGRRVWQALPKRGQQCYEPGLGYKSLSCVKGKSRSTWVRTYFLGAKCNGRGSVADGMVCLPSKTGSKLSWQKSPWIGEPCVRKGLIHEKVWKCRTQEGRLLWDRARPVPNFPESNPVRIEGAVDTGDLPIDIVFEALWGLPPGSVRTWTMRYSRTGDVATDYRTIINGIRSSGVTIKSNQLKYATKDTFLSDVNGRYKGWYFSIDILDWREFTVRLADLP